MAFTLTFNPTTLRLRRDDAIMLARTYRGLGLPNGYVEQAVHTARIYHRALVRYLAGARDAQ